MSLAFFRLICVLWISPARSLDGTWSQDIADRYSLGEYAGFSIADCSRDPGDDICLVDCAC